MTYNFTALLYYVAAVALQDNCEQSQTIIDLQRSIRRYQNRIYWLNRGEAAPESDA
ncbi:MAG: hypothetical protein ACREQ4_18480 [Candidatus Binataceae bacterium]